MGHANAERTVGGQVGKGEGAGRKGKQRQKADERGGEGKENPGVRQRFPWSPTSWKTDGHCESANELRSDRSFQSRERGRKRGGHGRATEAGQLSEEQGGGERRRKKLSPVSHKGPGVARRIVQQSCVLTQEKPRAVKRASSWPSSVVERSGEKKRAGGRDSSVLLWVVEDVKVDGAKARDRGTRGSVGSVGRSPVACSCLIERSPSMREIDEIRTCGTNTQVLAVPRGYG